MPVWGAYNRKLLYSSVKFIDPSYGPEALVRTRILTIIDYLNCIQEKNKSAVKNSEAIEWTD